MWVGGSFCQQKCFSYKECLDHKTYFAKVVQSAQPWVSPISRPCHSYLGPLAAILDFVGSCMFLIEGLLESKNIFSKRCSERLIAQCRPISRPRQQFWPRWQPFWILRHFMFLIEGVLR